MLKENTKEVVKKGIVWFKSLKWYWKALIIIVIIGQIGQAFEKKKPEVKVDKENIIDNVSSTEAFVIAKNIIELGLKSPSTAEFPIMDYRHNDLGNNIFVIQSYVDSQNGFGAMIRTNYTIKLKYNKGEWASPRNWTIIDLKTE